MKLQDHINQLPKHSVDLGLWKSIEEQIPQGQHVVERLPRHKANPLLWNAIEAQLDQASKSHHRLSFNSWSIAASIAIIITLSFVFYSQQSTTHVYYSEEIVMESNIPNNFQVETIDVMNNCQDQPAICSTPDFTRLKSSLDRLKVEEKKLRELQKSTQDPKIEMYHSRLVKDIQKVEAQILELFS